MSKHRGIEVDLNQAELVGLELEPQSGLTRIYRNHRDAFLMYCRRYQCPTEFHLEAYHDAVLVFFDMFNAGKYDGDKASIKTLIFAIGKNKLLEKMRREGKFKSVEILLENDVNLQSFQTKEEAWGDNEGRIEIALNQLSVGCREILVMFYYLRYSIEAIQNRMNHANENVTKSHKSRCLKKMKALFKTIKL